MVDTSLINVLVFILFELSFITPTIGRLVAESTTQAYDLARNEDRESTKWTMMIISPVVGDSRNLLGNLISLSLIQEVAMSSDNLGIR